MLWLTLSAKSGLPPSLLQRLWTSKDFTLLKAFERLHTLDADGWLQAAQSTRAIVAQEYPRGFIPVKLLDEDERRRRRAQEAEEMLDRDAED